MKKRSAFCKFWIVFLFLCGFACIVNGLNAWEEKELIYGTVEHTYIADGKNSPASPMCRVSWVDKDGDRHINGMPDDANYEEGDLYPIWVDAESHSREILSVKEGIAGLIIGGVTFIGGIVIIKKTGSNY